MIQLNEKLNEMGKTINGYCSSPEPLEIQATHMPTRTGHSFVKNPEYHHDWGSPFEIERPQLNIQESHIENKLGKSKKIISTKNIEECADAWLTEQGSMSKDYLGMACTDGSLMGDYQQCLHRWLLKYNYS